jgi:hypothetical protein
MILTENRHPLFGIMLEETRASDPDRTMIGRRMAGRQGVCTHKSRDGDGAPINVRFGALAAGPGAARRAVIGAAAGERKTGQRRRRRLVVASLGATMLGVTSVKNNDPVLHSYRAADEA